MKIPYKKKVHKLATILLAASAFAFFGCGDEEVEGEEKFELGDNVYQFESETLTLTGVNGKSIYLAKVNSSASIDSKPLSVLTGSVSGVTLSTNLSPTLNISADSSVEELLPAKKHYVMSDIEKQLAAEFGKAHVAKYGKQSRAALQALYATHTSDIAKSDTLTIDTEDNSGGIWIQTGADNTKYSSYSKKNATAYAVNDYCIVWVVDGCYDSTDEEDITTKDASKKTVSQARIDALASNFAKIYPIETKVFGTESDSMYSMNLNDKNEAVREIIDMTDCEDNSVGTKINIVICNLPDGFEGYFAPKDYYCYGYLRDEVESSKKDIIDCSNCGKFFYIDASAVNESISGAYLTLAHEFQHMIAFNMKTIQNNATFTTFMDEMCSMVCEDMMSTSLNISDDDTPKQRLPVFNKNYYSVGVVGVNEWRNDTDNNLLYSYAQAYAFGAWICRQYGGAQLMNAILTNAHDDMYAVTSAIKSISGEEFTTAQLLERYIQALVFNTTSFTHPTLNQDAKETLTYGSGNSQYKYPMKAINLWKLDEALPTYKQSHSTSSYKYDGPEYLSATDTTTLRPNGYTLHEIGTASADSVTLKLSGSPVGNTKYYVLVQ